METKKYASIKEYIADFPENVATILNKIRECIQKSAPNAEETISYNMPAFKQKKVLVYFAAYKNHIGFYALPSGNKAFQEEISKYKTGKGSIQFPLNEDIPYELIKKIVEFRVMEINE
ncbi:Uncharacterized conserved protein YdhG, YjbR/CyaY-like superfamily, DUF1801 family [Flavobacterium swingsii]|jgi:uncharacterized protein YdhG (YjbR/CyaY superfamily)|uniref:Uncharacterized conserved protein YdhG, YjbR/CyaY-like superfamily, DUF1801 family n=1 Tax=Flavobacterium swingsii TaxID=498292 RepID=A0A1I0ZB08_9FLAO|nr:DUF1801 domain-containing protein [Flavobacterium swingsii]SFB21750.1 Uncharacterized conserved protein YdhG, YjbR/CyaY-like superfamily, DUF1801 family [Flavobacterium swingsii]